MVIEVKKYLHEQFTIKDMSFAKFLPQFGDSILKDVGLQCANSARPYKIKGRKLISDMGQKLSDPKVYRRMDGRLLYLSLATLDITYSVQQLSQFIQLASQHHLEVAHHVLKYLKGCPTKGIFFSTKSNL